MEKNSKKNKRKILFTKCKGICPGCGRKMSLNNPQAYRSYMTIDHIVPICRGGTNNIDNLQGMCRICNLQKDNSISNVNAFINDSGHYVSRYLH